MISEITVKITLGPQPSSLAEGSRGYSMVEVIPHPPNAFESSVLAAYDVPPVPDAMEESTGGTAVILVPEFEEIGLEAGQIAPPQELQGFSEENPPSSSTTEVRLIGEIAPPE
jgi:hypothetical protein